MKDLKHPPFSEIFPKKLQQPEVLSIVDRNNKIMEPFSEFVDIALFIISEYVRNRHDPFLKQGNDYIKDQIRESVIIA